MKRHIKICICLLSLLLAADIFAQQTGKIKNGFDVRNYPEVSLIYHSDNPDVLDKSDFWYLKEAGKSMAFNVETVPEVINNLPQTMLILWEDMAHNGYGQFDSKQILLSVSRLPCFGFLRTHLWNRLSRRRRDIPQNAR